MLLTFYNTLCSNDGIDDVLADLVGKQLNSQTFHNIIFLELKSLFSPTSYE